MKRFRLRRLNQSRRNRSRRVSNQRPRLATIPLSKPRGKRHPVRVAHARLLPRKRWKARNKMWTNVGRRQRLAACPESRTAGLARATPRNFCCCQRMARCKSMGFIRRLFPGAGYRNRRMSRIITPAQTSRHFRSGRTAHCARTRSQRFFIEHQACSCIQQPGIRTRVAMTRPDASGINNQLFNALITARRAPMLYPERRQRSRAREHACTRIRMLKPLA